MDVELKKNIPNPWETANPVSKIFFTWIFPLFRKGFSSELSIHDLPDAPIIHTSSIGANKLQQTWESEQANSQKSLQSPKFWKSLAYVHRWSVIIYLVTIAVDELFIRVMQPIYLRKLVQSFSDDSATKSDQAFYGGVVCLCSLLHDLMTHQCVYMMFRTGILCRTSMSSLLYQKSLRIRSENSSVGALINLLSNDLGRFDYQLVFLPYIFIGPLQLVILIVILYQEMGISALAGALFILIILPTQVVNGRLAAKFRRSVATKTDERSRIMNEIVMAIRVIKMYGWQDAFSDKINKVRRKEVSELGKRAYLRGFFLSLYTFSGRMSAFFVILTYVLLGNELTAEKAFFTVAIALTIVETMVFYFSMAISGLGECSVSIARVQNFLLLPEQQSNESQNEGILGNAKTDETIKEKIEMTNSLNSEPGKISLQHVSATWSGSERTTTTLHDITLELQGDLFVMVVGPVGSGKTSLLNVLISELPVFEGILKSKGKMSYSSQEPFIFPGNIRQNILFGDAFDPKRYEEVVTACALKDDFNQLPHGDLTLTGEKGVTLSGGQKARLSLARSLYRHADIYLMDDPLSAVDSRVSRHIFDKSVQGFLKGKLRILVTHQLQYLPQADYVIFLNNGEVHAQGTYESLIKCGVDFNSIMASDANKADEQNRRKSSVIEPPVPEIDILKEFEKPDDNLEKIAEGSVNLGTYWGYIKSASSYFMLSVIILLFIFGQFLITGCEYWLSYWTDSEDFHNFEEVKSNETFADSSSNTSSSSTMSSFETIEMLDRENYLGQETYLFVYSGLVVSLLAFTIAKSMGFFGYCLRISNNLHNRMFKAVVRAPTSFFDLNSSGRIMNRFAKDIGSIDELLPGSFYDTLDYSLQMVGVVFIIILSNYFLVIPTLIIVAIFWGLRFIFVRTSRDIKRLETIWKSPVFTHVASSLQGLTTIRALGAQEKLIKQFDQKQDVHTAAWFAFISTTRCFAVWAETVGIIFLTVVTFSFIVFSDGTSGGMVGLVVTSTLALAVNIQWAIRQSADLENHMTSVERALEYSMLTPEAPLEIPDKKPPPTWPSGGEITFRNVFLHYEDNCVLKNLNFDIRPREKIGIVGRTGAGKSSVISALFRLTEFKGSILIDGVNIGEIGLHDLRKSISIIPQDPVLFSGSVRYNLDPFHSFEDEQLWQVLEEVQLKDAVSALDFKVSDGGSNFSVGQRQLVCLGRAILRQNKIIVLDEATANVDPRTDEFIQKTIRQKFENCSIITIAHRLHSVMDCDRILVLEAGQLMEYDHPFTLLENRDSLLSKLADHTGKTSRERLRQMAKLHFQKGNCPFIINT